MAFENLGNQLMALGQLPQVGQSFDQGVQSAQQQQQNANILAQQQAQAEQAQAAQQQAQQQQLDVQHALDHPTADAFAALQAKYPKDQAAFKASWETRDAASRTADLTSLGSVIASIDSGRPKVAQKLIEDRLAADSAAGVDTSMVQMLGDAVKSGDTKKARGLASYLVAAAAGPEALQKLVNPTPTEPKVIGDKLVDTQGNVVYDGGGSKVEYKTLKDANGAEHLVKVGGDSGANVGTGGFSRIYSQWLAPTEGGYAARDGKSGAPVNFGVNQAANPDLDVSKLTHAQAATVLHDRYWNAIGADNITDPALQAVAFDTAVNMGPGIAKAMLKASDGDVNKMLAFRDQRYKAIGGPDVPNWLQRNAKLKAYVAGGSGAEDVTPPDMLGDAGGPDNGLMGQDYLHSLPAGERGVVSAIVRGDFPITSKMTSPKTIALFEKAARVDPTISATDYPKRVQTAKDFSSSGKSGQAITSIETLANHLHELAAASDALGGTDTFGRPGNYLLNAYARQTNNPALIRYNSAVDKIAPELDKFLSGKAATVSGTKEARASFDADYGPAGRKQAISTSINLLLGRLNPIGEAYSRGMNRTVDPKSLMRPDMAAKLDAVTQWAAGDGKLQAVAPEPALGKGADPAVAAALRKKYGLN